MWYQIVVAALAVTCLLESTFARRLEMFMAPEDVNDFYIEEKGSKDIECYVLADVGITVSLTWSGPLINASKLQPKSNIPRATEQRVGNWLNITQFTDAHAGSYTCRAKTSAGDDLLREIKILKSCEAGKYNPPDCTNSCSTHCKPRSDGTKGRTCHHISGACLYGCQPGYEGSLCTATIPDDSSGLGGGGIAGIVLAIVVVLVIGLCCVPMIGKPIRKKIRTCLGWETGPGGGEGITKYSKKNDDEENQKMLQQEEDKRNGADGGGGAGGRGDVGNEVKVEQLNKEPPAKPQDKDADGDEISEEQIQRKVASETMAAPQRAAGANLSIQPKQMEHEIEEEPLRGATASPPQTDADVAYKLDEMKQIIEKNKEEYNKKMEEYLKNMEKKDKQIQDMLEATIVDKDKQIAALTKERDEIKKKYDEVWEERIESVRKHERILERAHSVREDFLEKQRNVNVSVNEYDPEDRKKLQDVEAENKKLEEELKRVKEELETMQRGQDQVSSNKSASKSSSDDSHPTSKPMEEASPGTVIVHSDIDSTAEEIGQAITWKDERRSKP